MNAMQDEYADFARLYAAFLDPLLHRTRQYARGMVRDLGVSNILDICCGTGALCRDLAADGLDVTGVDLSSAMLAEAKRRTRSSASVRYLTTDARSLPFEDKAFGVCVLSLCLHENEPADRSRILSEASRVAHALVLVDYAADMGLLGALAHVPERLAGRRHYAAFRNFTAHGGLEGLLAAEGYAVLARRRVLFGAGVCIRSERGGRWAASAPAADI
ncbi:methyltransferase type 11 [Oceanidesulfovibrio indonesiensis]|uniref:Methyltransferase type 11 n=1 Tax=Oceanidesulfovibrio indonesiensis TaxID=54767 RepID=A0A7M3MJC8_9BACT|nr:class I SAM-dependent methyltransferase [Oceanidesulfovibrio indonesiensis]TVM19875.1 methyltransferase type 11 [Oceanidesulfovibrio indonesiensis]